MATGPVMSSNYGKVGLHVASRVDIYRLFK